VNIVLVAAEQMVMITVRLKSALFTMLKLMALSLNAESLKVVWQWGICTYASGRLIMVSAGS
jgi:hypothetical protein